jgi:ubiquinone/menaquinone biosynthesis C-methylase UbiE
MSSSSASASSSLLPKSHSQFHEKAYWDSFFRDRGQEAFEWYGEFQDLAGNLFRRIKREDRILVIGCGNSNLSACLYDKGFKNITNLDFSDTVIEEMRTKNTERDQMRWIVGDMTNMSGLENESFEVVLDKGALDALVSENSEFHAQQAASMFNEISRVLVPKGRYACITLAESFVLGSFMKYFCPQQRSPGPVVGPCLWKWCYVRSSLHSYLSLLLLIKMRAIPNLRTDALLRCSQIVWVTDYMRERSKTSRP